MELSVGHHYGRRHRTPAQIIHQFSLGFTTAEDALAASEEVNANFGDVIHAYPNRCAVDIIPADISKEQAISHTLAIFGWDGAEILAIGDEVNDLPMILATTAIPFLRPGRPSRPRPVKSMTA